MTVETYCVCGSNIKRTYGRPSGLPYKGEDSLKVRVSLVSRLTDQHPSRIHLCKSCRREFARRRRSSGESSGDAEGSVRLCDFCRTEVDGAISKAVKGPLGAVKSWSGRKQGASDAYERLDVCVDCQESFMKFVEEKRD